MTLERHMFVNYDDDVLTIEIKAYENVQIFELLTEGEDIEELVDTQEVPQNSQYVLFDMHIPARTIWGFGVYNTPEYTNPDEERLTIVTASGKNPWPSPPPPPPPPYDTEYYSTRVADFLIALSGDRTKPVRVRPKQVALKPTGTR